MKAQFFLAVVLVILRVGSLEGVAQGLVSFNNSSVQVITNCKNGASITNPATVAMYYTTNLTAVNDPSVPMMLNTNAIVNMLFFPGRFFGGTVAVPGAPAGSYIVVEVRAWHGNDPTWEAGDLHALCGSGFSGKSARFLVGPLGNGTNSSPTALSGMTRFGVCSRDAPHPVECFGPPPVWTISVVPGASPYQVRASGKPMENLSMLLLQSSPNLSPYSWRRRLEIYPGTNSWALEWTDPEGTNVTVFYRIISVY